MSDIPDGVDTRTAIVAVAWEIVKSSTPRLSEATEEQQRQYYRMVTNRFIEVFKALVHSEPIEGDGKVFYSS